MSSRASCDETSAFTLPSVSVPVNVVSEKPNDTSLQFLTDYAPQQKPWDQHRGETDDVLTVFAASPFARHRRYAERLAQCSRLIGFARDPPAHTGALKLRLRNARFCRVRQCPVCMWRRSLMWQARLHRALPKLTADYPQARFLFATFTVKNCEVHQLRRTLTMMAHGWKRLTEVKTFPAIGWVRSMEVTRGRRGDAHPHFHSLLMVQPDYFRTGYMTQPQWAELWRQCTRLDYTPVIDIRVVDPAYSAASRTRPMTRHPVWNAASEVLKYTVKVSDMLKDDKWFLSVCDELWKMRAVAIGGVLKQYLKDRKKEDFLADPGQEEAAAVAAQRFFFGWQQQKRRYRKVG